MIHRSSFVFFVACLLAVGCSRETKEVSELRHFPIDGMEGIITQSGVEFDGQLSTDGNGSLKVTTTEPFLVRLFEVRGIDVQNARLTYEAKMRTEDVEGQVYLEMWCRFPGKGEYFSRGLQSPLSGTADWTTQQISFVLGKKEIPDLVKLNLVVKGTGTVWIDDVRLFKGPLQ